MNTKRFFSLLAAVIVLIAFSTVTMAASSATNKSSLFSRKQSGGMFSIVDETDGVGNIWFVDSGSATGADAAGYGQNPDAPFLTIDYAIGQTTASNGDRIFVAAGHAENMDAYTTAAATAGAGSITLDVAGIRIIGQGIGRSRPTLTWTDHTDSITVNAANVSLENFIFDMSATSDVAVASGLSFFANATDFEFLNNEVILAQFGGGSATTALNLWSGGTRTLIQGNRFIADTSVLTSGVSSVISINANALNDIQIIDNFISASSNLPLIYGATSAISGFYMSGMVAKQHHAYADGATVRAWGLGVNARGVILDSLSAYPSGVTYTTGITAQTNDY